MENLVSNIEALSQAKGIDPQVIIDAVKDAIVVAARKYYHTTEDLVAEFDPTGGQVQVYALKTVTDLVSNPMKEVSMTEARRSPAVSFPSVSRTTACRSFSVCASSSSE